MPRGRSPANNGAPCQPDRHDTPGDGRCLARREREAAFMSIDRWAINPRTAAGPLFAKMPRDECRAALGDWNEFQKSKYLGTTTDAFDEKGIHAYYDAAQRLTYLEVHSFGSTVPLLDDLVLFGEWASILRQLDERGVACEVDDFGDTARLPDVGIRLYRYDPSETDVLSVEVQLPSEDDIPAPDVSGPGSS